MIWSVTVAIRCCNRRLPSRLFETSTPSPWLIPAKVERLLSRRLGLDSSFASPSGCQRAAEGYSQPNPHSFRPTAALTVSGTRWRAELRQRRTKAVGWSRTAGTEIQHGASAAGELPPRRCLGCGVSGPPLTRGVGRPAQAAGYVRRRPTLPRGHHAVPSALESLASGFGMGPGVSSPLWPP